MAYRLGLLSSDIKWLRQGKSQITIINFSYHEKYAGMYLIIISSLYVAIFILLIKYLIERGYICNNLVYSYHAYNPNGLTS